MDVRSLASIPQTALVHERNAGGNRRDPEAFRRALQEHGQGQTPEARQDARASVASVRRALQVQAQARRKDEGEVMHVDVLA